MNKKDMLYSFIKRIEKKKLLTLFIRNICGYEKLQDYNYIFRIINEDNCIIIDIYDNISDNRFNRYIFNFSNESSKNNSVNDGNVFVTYIDVNMVYDSDNKLYKLAYLTKISDDKIIEYAKSFLDSKLIDILKEIIKK